MRRLPVIQPTVLERRAFLLGLLATTALACSSSESTSPLSHRTDTSSGDTGSSGSGTSTDSGSGDGDEADGSSPEGDAGTDPTSGMDSSTGPTGCAVDGVDVGPPSSFAMGTITYNASPTVYIGRDAGGLYAMYGLCTHAIGNMKIDGSMLTCLVHGAQFTLTGDVLKGPATTPLPHYYLCLNSKGNVAVDTKIPVIASTRLVA